MPKYTLTADSTEAVEKKLDDLWKKLRTNKGLLQDLSEAGLEPADIPRGRRQDFIVIKSTHQGVFEHGSDILVTLAPWAVAVTPAVKRAVTDIWKRIMLPRLEGYLGPPKSPKAPRPAKRKTSKKRPAKNKK
jgi:hypothetical protein